MATRAPVSRSSARKEDVALARRTSEKSYREQWKWDSVAWGTHCVDCYPGNCPYRVYVKDGRVSFEEPAGMLTAGADGSPDNNPMGCNKGAGWSQTLYSEERLLHPLKRAAERGAGKWEQVSWDQAAAEIADALLDAIEAGGPETIIHEMTPAEGGTTAQWPCGRLIAELLGGLRTDVNGVINDFQQGCYITWGKFNPPANTSRFLTELNLIWHANPIYTSIPRYHSTAEGRYRGAEVVLIAPDCSPSHTHADYYVPIRIGTDAALALSMCKVIVDEGLLHADFVKEQTDLPLLVRLDTKRFLRESDLREDGADDQFYFLNSKTRRVVKAPLATLALGKVDPSLTGSARVTLLDGSSVEVVPAFALLQELLEEYEPEKATEICGVHPKTIRMLARKVASKKTSVNRGMNLCKYYHGDLMERAMLLLLAFTGNWGTPGTGMASWGGGGDLRQMSGQGIFSAKQAPGREEAKRVIESRRTLNFDDLKVEDPTWTDEMVAIDSMIRLTRLGATRMVPTAFLYYYHYGYKDNWNNPEWGDPTMKRSFDEYINEAIDRGWWQGVARPTPETAPRVLIEVGGNMLRRQRGGQTQLMKEIWPKLKTIITVDWRMNTTAMFSDYVLPAAQHYEKLTFHFLGAFSDRAAEPPGEALPEWEIFGLIAKKIEERAAARGMKEYQDGLGRTRSLENLHYRYSLGLETEDELVDEWLQDEGLTGALQPGTASLEFLRQNGERARVEREPLPLARGRYTGLRDYTEDKVPYPTLTRRAQFYIDHDWFLEAGEAFPVHKENPKMGGDYPFELTSGHNRWSIHSMNITNWLMLQTNRGKPHMVMNSNDAAAKGIVDDQSVRAFNDMGSFEVPVKLSPSVRPGQVIVYNGWDPYQFEGWKGPMDTEPGMIKWLHLAGGYGHLRYWPIQWQPCPVDRAVRLDVAPV
jgi:DMSO reductase family type II enzyme molybdopterin subunit